MELLTLLLSALRSTPTLTSDVADGAPRRRCRPGDGPASDDTAAAAAAADDDEEANAAPPPPPPPPPTPTTTKSKNCHVSVFIHWVVSVP